MASKYRLEVKVCDRPELVYRGADIVASLTDATRPVLDGALLEAGAHVVNIGGGGGLPDDATMERVDIYLRFGDAPPAEGLEAVAIDDEYLRWRAGRRSQDQPRKRAHGVMLPEKRITLADLVAGRAKGRSLPDDWFLQTIRN